LNKTFHQQLQLIRDQLNVQAASKLHQSAAQVHALASKQVPMAYVAWQPCHLDCLEVLNQMQESFQNQFVRDPRCHDLQEHLEELRSELGTDA
jgi:hypothetical protein